MSLIQKNQVEGLADAAIEKANLAGAVAPTITDDSGSGYAVGSRWIDTVADKEYVCTDATAGAAVWVETTSTGGGGGATNLGVTASPTGVDVTSDTGTDATLPLATGVNAGVQSPADKTKVDFITATAAVDLDEINNAVGKSSLAETAAPLVTSDSASGYSVGSRWIDTTNDKEYVCLDASVGAAVWTETTQSGGVSGGSGYTSDVFTLDYGSSWNFASNSAQSDWNEASGNWSSDGNKDVVIPGSATQTYNLRYLPIMKDFSTGGDLQWDTTRTIQFETTIATGSLATSTNAAAAVGLGNRTTYIPSDALFWEGMYFVKNNSTNVWSAHTGDGATGVNTVITVANDTIYKLKAILTPGVDAKFYMNDVLVATHTTNLPSSASPLSWSNNGKVTTGTYCIKYFAAPTITLS